MLKLVERLPADDRVTDDVVTLTCEQRQRSRLKTQTDKGVEVGIFLQRGKPLQDGEVLVTGCGLRIGVRAASESVAEASTDSWQLFSRVCYHLGNRHIPLQIGDRWLRFKPDHVLEAMVIGFGLSVGQRQTVFEPEPGAYSSAASGGHSHSHHHAV